jgi:hypothetical protein
VRGVVCGVFVLAVACAANERAATELPPCNERFEVELSFASEPTMLSLHRCFAAPACTTADAYASLVDIDPNVPGDQYDCTVIDAERSLPMCELTAPPSNTPCWRIVSDPTCTGIADNIAMEVLRDRPAAQGTLASASCLAQCMVLPEYSRCESIDP